MDGKPGHGCPFLKEKAMGLFRFLFGPKPAPSWYMDTMTAVSSMFNRPILWASDGCHTGVLIVEPETDYVAGAALVNDSTVLVGVSSKIKVYTPALRMELARRNREVVYGSWLIISEESLFLKVDMQRQDFTPEQLFNAIQTLLAEVQDFDQEWLGRKTSHALRKA
jgi:hypothetical protein